MKNRPVIKVVTLCRKGFPAPLQTNLKKAAEKTLRMIPYNVVKKQTGKISIGFITIVVVGPKTIQKLNATYRKKNKPTDVLSFSRMNSGLPDFSFEEPDLGEVLICWDIAKKQAIEYKTTIKEELERLTVHGVLHLFGYDHETGPSEEKKMFTLQDKILKTL